RAGMMSAVKHLAELGHKRIAFLGGFPDTAVFDDRLAVYRSGMEAAGFQTARAQSVANTEGEGIVEADGCRGPIGKNER
ncbi:substrate-binding domain-containing protein, partial [Rhizobium johnstonii]|uniref:substrate-binding domain-containing protein n=1 Tax=Rhizobium johnstonii TaxID=3019933 RepID=UPI003F9B712A